MISQEKIQYLNVRNRLKYPEESGAGEAFFVDDGGLVKAHFRGFVLESAFQPLFDVRRGNCIGVEALIRGSSLGRGPVSPEGLFALPKEGREFVYLDRLCRTLHSANFALSDGFADLYLNVDPRHLLAVSDHGLVFESVIRSLGIEPERIVLEILENEIADIRLLEEAVKNFRARGFRIAIDDFGRGHANLERLWKLGPDVVKFDRFFLETASKDIRVRGALPRLVEVIRSHGATIVFEGIEDDVHLSIARESGSDLVQGYLLARPGSRVVVKPTDRIGTRDSEAPSGFRNRPSSKLGSGS